MWITYALIGMTLLGLGDYIRRLVIGKGANKDIFLLLCFVIYMIVLFINMIIFGDKNLSNDMFKSSLIIGSFDFLIPVGMLASIKYLDASTTFVAVRLSSSFAVFGIGLWYFGDNLSVLNIIGFLLGAIAIYMLSGFSWKEKHKIHKKGVIAATLATIGIIGSNSYFKYAVPSLDIPTYTFFKFGVTFLLLVLYMTIRKKFTEFNKDQIMLALPYALATSIVFLTFFLYILPQIYLQGTLSLSYKILSYSIIVPIILSVIFLGEKVTKTRMIAFILTIISLALFI